ncbi:MAG: GspE/PulE family protein [Akkermansia sp.]|nr:type II/IV secretion system protein [Akkermansia sp.]MDO4751659.1 GspE/PulE family protein [Akkermansia sp.]
MYSNENYLLDLLVEAGAIDAGTLDGIKAELSPLDSAIDYLIKNNFLTAEYIAQVAAYNSAMEYVDLTTFEVDPNIISGISGELARRVGFLPIGDDGYSLQVAIADPFDMETLDSLPQFLGREVSFFVASEAGLKKAIDKYYPEKKQHAKGDSEAPIIELIDNMFNEAHEMRASDIHIEPMEDRIRMRYRVDGRLVEVANHPKKLLGSIVARLKVMSSSMSIAEKRVPQDGRIEMDLRDGAHIDLRVSTIPTNHGESVVMRILDKSALSLGLPQLGFLSDDEATFDRLVTLPDGVILVTGPTGSGKTTTLYACLNHLNRPDKKIITAEDPVEYEMAGINQVMIRSEIGMTFAAALRAMLRQAPNIIMVGEIRDGETAGIAIQAAMTGHLVLSTLHTNDAPSSVARLADMGIDRFLIASAVRAIMAQRLCRSLCSCRIPGQLTQKQAETLGIDINRQVMVANPNGCAKCRGKGMKGRMGIFEIFQVTDDVRGLINSNLTSAQLRKRARELGMRTLREDGIRKVLAGRTTADEIIRVTTGDAS